MVYVLVAWSHSTVCDPMDCSLPGSSVHGISRQEYWSGLAVTSPGDLPDSGIKPGSPACRQILYPLSHQGNTLLWRDIKLMMHYNIFQRWRVLYQSLPQSQACARQEELWVTHTILFSRVLHSQDKLCSWAVPCWSHSSTWGLRLLSWPHTYYLCIFCKWLHLIIFETHFKRCCCCLVAKLSPTLCDPMNCSPPGFPVLHHLLEFAQTHVHRVSDAI